MMMRARLVSLCLGLLVFAPTGESRRTNTVQHALAMINKTKSAKGELISCQTFKFLTPEGKTLEISRSQSAGQVAAKVGKALAAAAILATTIAASYYSAGLFDSFIAANEAVPVHKLVYSGSRVVGFDYLGLYYKKSAIMAFGQTLTFLAGGSGAGAGALVTAAGQRIGLEVGDLVNKEEAHEDRKWLEQYKDKCALAYFDVAAPQGVPVDPTANAYSKADSDGLAQLEDDTDKRAQDAIAKWCVFYAKHRLFGGESHAPVPEVCKIVLRGNKQARRCGGGGEIQLEENTLTCKSIISLSQEEQAFQMATMQMKIMSKMQDKAARTQHCESKMDMHLDTESASEQMLCNGGQSIDDENKCPQETLEEARQELKEVEEEKAAAMYDCLAVQSCNLLRKDSTNLQGQNGWMFKKQKHNDMLDMVVKRCSGHSKLFGQDAVFGCTEGKNCPNDTPEMFLPLVPREAAPESPQAAEPRECGAEEPAEKNIESGKCECIDGAEFSTKDGTCQCIEPPENSNKVSFMDMLPHKQCKEKCEDGLVEVKEGDATRCISNFVFKLVALNGKSLAQKDCGEGKLELQKDVCITKEMVDGILEAVKSA